MRKFFILLCTVLCTVCSGGIARACESNEIDVLGNGTQCEIAKFSITTTNLSANGEFRFYMSAKGNFYVDCDGGTLSGTGVSGKTVTRTTTDNELYTCTYSTGGVKTINFGGLATGYSTDTSTAVLSFSSYDNLSADEIDSISGNLSLIFPKFNTLANGEQPRFFRTFYGSTNLTSIPDSLFANYTTGASYMFSYTFYRCRGLLSLPANLFSSIITGADCMFDHTFTNSLRLSGYIPVTTFAGLISHGSPNATSMWNNTFYGTRLATSCPSGTTQYMTGYEGNSGTTTWNGMVACVSITPVAITLDATGATTGAVPSTVYLSYDTGWYADSGGNNAITSLSTSPTKTGKIFAGFYTGENATGKLIIDAGGNFINNTFTLESTTLYAYFGDTTYNVTYSCGNGTGTAPANETVISGNQFIPATNSCTKSGYAFAGWLVSDTTDVVGPLFTWNYNENKTLTAQWSKFALTTKKLSANDTFQFSMSAVGTFTVNCGEGGTLSGTGVSGNTITRSNTTSTTYTCTYSTDGKKTIGFEGEATSYNTDTKIAAISFYQSLNNSASKISSISGNLSVLFPYISGNKANGAQPRFYQTFYGATNLTSIPDTLFANYTIGATYMFPETFQGCSSLTSLPADLFSGITTGASYMFQYTFNNCTSITSIPQDLFSGLTTGESYMFYSTFTNCTSITSIPARLFSRITIGANAMFGRTFLGCTGLTSLPADLFSGITIGVVFMFGYTFQNCTGLTSIPAGLFSRITTGANYLFNNTFRGCTSITSIPDDLFSGITTAADNMFYYTFYGCTNLAGYIPPSTFAGLVANNHPTATNMWKNTFYNTQLVESCPNDTTQYITGYEGTDTTDYTLWNGKVSCTDETMVCDAGKYLAAHGYECSTCPVNNYCSGGTYTYSENTQQGITACSTGYSAPAGSSSSSACTPNTITINWEDGETSSCTYDGTFTVPSTIPTKRGHVFTGWTFE